MCCAHTWLYVTMFFGTKPGRGDFPGVSTECEMKVCSLVNRHSMGIQMGVDGVKSSVLRVNTAVSARSPQPGL